MGAIMIGVALLFLLTVVLQYFEGASNFGYIRSMLAVEKVVSTAVRDTIPTKSGWKDLTRWIIIAVASTLSGWCDALSTRAHNWEEYHRHKKNVCAMREQMHLIDIILVTMIFLPLVRPRAQSVTPAAQRRCNGDNDPSGEVFPSALSWDRIPHCRTYHFLHRKHRSDVAEIRSSFKIREDEGK